MLTAKNVGVFFQTSRHCFEKSNDKWHKFYSQVLIPCDLIYLGIFNSFVVITIIIDIGDDDKQ